MADCYVSAVARSAGAAAEQAACRKSAKYNSSVKSGHTFRGRNVRPSERVCHCVFDCAAPKNHLCLRRYLRNQLSVPTDISPVQRFYSILLHNSFSSDEEWPFQLYVLTLFLTSGSVLPRVFNNNNTNNNNNISYGATRVRRVRWSRRHHHAFLMITEVTNDEIRLGADWCHATSISVTVTPAMCISLHFILNTTLLQLTTNQRT